MANYSARQRFALAAPIMIAERRNPGELGGWDREGIARARGEDDLYEHCRAYLAPLGIATVADVHAWVAAHAQSATGIARAVVVLGSAVWAQLMSDDEAWRALYVLAQLAQDSYDSWDAYGAALGADAAVWHDVPWPSS